MEEPDVYLDELSPSLKHQQVLCLHGAQVIGNSMNCEWWWLWDKQSEVEKGLTLERLETSTVARGQFLLVAGEQSPAMLNPVF